MSKYLGRTLQGSRLTTKPQHTCVLRLPFPKPVRVVSASFKKLLQRSFAFLALPLGDDLLAHFKLSFHIWKKDPMQSSFQSFGWHPQLPRLWLLHGSICNVRDITQIFPPTGAARCRSRAFVLLFHRHCRSLRIAACGIRISEKDSQQIPYPNMFVESFRMTVNVSNQHYHPDTSWRLAKKLLWGLKL